MMIPVLDRPAIHFAVEEAAAAGIDHVVFVVSPGQEAVPRYFHRMPDLEAALESRGETERLRQMLAISDMVDTTTVVQERQLGLGHAVLMAREAVGGEAFAVLLPDDLIWGESPTTSAMIDLFSSYGGSVVAVNTVPDEVVPAKGVIAHVPVAERVSRVEAMVEKPALEDAPSNLAIVGRYVLTPEVFDALDRGPARGPGRATAHRRHSLAASSPGGLRLRVPRPLLRPGNAPGAAQGVAVRGPSRRTLGPRPEGVAHRHAVAPPPYARRTPYWDSTRSRGPRLSAPSWISNTEARIPMPRAASTLARLSSRNSTSPGGRPTPSRTSLK